jgi:hypothetical protein
MAVYVKENTVSLFLLSATDIINKNIPSPQPPTNFTKLSSSISDFDAAQAFEILRRESELFSFNPMPSAEMAEELYKDLEPLQTRADEYVIHHDIVFKNGDEYVKFNIEQENLKNTSTIQSPEDPLTGFYVQSIQIKNAPKDIFTTRANYTITIKILFNFFDDLLKNSVQMFDVATNEERNYELPIIKILYKKYFNGQINSISGNTQDSEGIYLVQRLQFKNNTEKFAETSDAAGSDEIGKTYHLISKQHEFNICKSNEPGFIGFDNELTITYVASEIEALPDQGENLAEIERTNLFNLLNNFKGNTLTQLKTISSGRINSTVTVTSTAGDTLISNLQYYITLIDKYKKDQSWIRSKLNCFELADKEKDPAKRSALEFQGGLKIGSPAGGKYTPEYLRDELRKNKESIDAILFELNRALMLAILLECNIYEIQGIDNSLLNTFEQNFIFSEYFGNLDSGRYIGLATSFALTAGLTVLTGGAAGAALAIGAGTSLAPEVASLISEIAKEPLISSDLDVGQIRSRLTNPTVIKIDTTSGVTQQDRVSAIFPKSSIAKTTANTKVVTTTSNSVLFKQGANADVKDIEKEIQQNFSIQAAEADDPNSISGTSNIRFIRFLDLINIYQKLNKSVKIITGGKIILSSVSTSGPKFIYINNADYLISLEAFTNFLYKNIMLKDRKLFYDSEEFLRDAFQNLLGKDLVSSNESLSVEIKKLAPTNLRFNTSINVNTPSLTNELTNGSKDIFSNDSQFLSLKKEIFKTRNISTRNFGTIGGSPASGQNSTNLVKLMFLGCDQDIKYYDFYSEYSKYLAQTPSLIINNSNTYSSKVFQKFINEKYLIPCIPIRNVASVETILKSKNITFSRIDNKNLESGVILADSSVRLPYQIKAKLQPYLTFFLGSSNYVFVAPPETSTPNTQNIFGFGGLYIIKQTNYEWNFVNAAGANPAFSSYLDIDGYHVSYGDGVKISSKYGVNSVPSDCTNTTIGPRPKVN